MTYEINDNAFVADAEKYLKSLDFDIKNIDILIRGFLIVSGIHGLPDVAYRYMNALHFIVQSLDEHTVDTPVSIRCGSMMNGVVKSDVITVISNKHANNSELLINVLNASNIETDFFWSSLIYVKRQNGKIIAIGDHLGDGYDTEYVSYIVANISEDTISKLISTIRKEINTLHILNDVQDDIYVCIADFMNYLRSEYNAGYADFIHWLTEADSTLPIGYAEYNIKNWDKNEGNSIGLINDEHILRYKLLSQNGKKKDVYILPSQYNPISNEMVVIIGVSDGVKTRIIGLEVCVNIFAVRDNFEIPVIADKANQAMDLIANVNDIVLRDFAQKLFRSMCISDMLERTPRELSDLAIKFIYENEYTYSDSVSMQFDEVSHYCLITACRAYNRDMTSHESQIVQQFSDHVKNISGITVLAPSSWSHMHELGKIIISQYVTYDPNIIVPSDNKAIKAIKYDLRIAMMTWKEQILRYIKINKYECDQSFFDRIIFNDGYKKNTEYQIAAEDLSVIQHINEDKRFDIRLSLNKSDNKYISIYCYDDSIMLSHIISVLNDFGVTVLNYRKDYLQFSGHKILLHRCYISVFHINEDFDIAHIESCFNDIAGQIIYEGAFSDALNSLVFTAGFDKKNIQLVRGYIHYLFQLNSELQRSAVLDVAKKHHKFFMAFVAYFYDKFVTTSVAVKNINDLNSANRIKKIVAILHNIQDAEQIMLACIEQVAYISHIEHSVIKMLHSLLCATARSNFELMRDCISYKIICDASYLYTGIKQYREVFVMSPDFEGVHIRYGKCSRGGLRWSNRADYRCEILGLANAQRVKNAFIIPDGAKGGFYIKKDVSQSYDMVKSIYQDFIRSLLDVIDNNGKPYVSKVDPRDVDDNYFVVAADKGTATFSDLANSVSSEYKFWLNDALASGSSNGYDHKKMGITARGAWETVKQHFFELGINPESDIITVFGVGDMSGDVFGNGLLLSRTVKLLCAYNGRLLFIDPNPNPEKSFIERKRLFDQCMQWDQYSPDVLSKGGMVIPMSQPIVEVTQEIAEKFGIQNKKIEPKALFKHIIQHKFDLIFFGGIGSYIKSSEESNESVGDAFNDDLRVNGNMINSKVISEGANLAVTQMARIEAGLNHVMLNTDFIDNASGVTTSDYEVNIKIALTGAMHDNIISSDERNAILHDMTDDIAQTVLHKNRMQGVAISLDQERISEVILIRHIIDALYKAGVIKNVTQSLHPMRRIQERTTGDKLLSRPEISFMLSSTKLAIYNTIADIDISQDKIFEEQLFAYFPKYISKDSRIIKYISSHLLANRIVFRNLSSEIIDTCGMYLPIRYILIKNTDPNMFVLAYMLINNVFNIQRIMYTFALDNSDMQWHINKDALLMISDFMNSNMQNSIDVIQNTYNNNLDELVEKFQYICQHMFYVIKQHDLYIPSNYDIKQYDNERIEHIINLRYLGFFMIAKILMDKKIDNKEYIKSFTNILLKALRTLRIIDYMNGMDKFRKYCSTDELHSLDIMIKRYNAIYSQLIIKCIDATINNNDTVMLNIHDAQSAIISDIDFQSLNISNIVIYIDALESIL